MSSIESGFAEVNGTKLYYEVAGQGDPIVLIHGFTLDTRMWDDQFKEFSKHYRVIRYDVRGFGKSSTPIEGEPYSNQEDLKALLDYLDIREAHIVGLSMGGGIAINFTLEYPDYASSLITVDSSLAGHTWSTQVMPGVRKIAEEESVEAGLEAFINCPLFEPALRNPNVADRVKQIVRSYSGWALVHDNPQKGVVPSPHSRLHEIKCSTLAIVGEHDTPDFHEIANMIDRDVLNSRKCVLQGVGHMSNMEAPEAFNREVLDFLESLK